MADKENRTGNRRESHSKRLVGGSGSVVKNDKGFKVEVTKSEGATTGVGPTGLGSKRNIHGSGCVVGSGNCP